MGVRGTQQNTNRVNTTETKLWKHHDYKRPTTGILSFYVTKIHITHYINKQEKSATNHFNMCNKMKSLDIKLDHHKF